MDSDDEYPSQEDHVFDFAWKGDLALVQQAVAEGIVTLDQRQECDGQTLLHNACEGGRDHVVEWLIGKGANVNAREDRGEIRFFLLKEGGVSYGFLRQALMLVLQTVIWKFRCIVHA